MNNMIKNIISTTIVALTKRSESTQTVPASVSTLSGGQL